MPKKLIAFRADDKTVAQLEELQSWDGTTQTATIARAVETYHRQRENERREGRNNPAERETEMADEGFSRIVGGKRYDTTKATLLASDRYWDGHNMERNGRNTYLYRTPKGAYFQVTYTMWQGEHDNLIPISQGEAIELYEDVLTEHEVSYEEAFPGVEVEDA